MCKVLYTSLRAISKKGVVILLSPDTVFMVPSHVPAALGEPMRSIRPFETKLRIDPVSKSAEVSKMNVLASLTFTLETHCM